MLYLEYINQDHGRVLYKETTLLFKSLAGKEMWLLILEAEEQSCELQTFDYDRLELDGSISRDNTEHI